MAVQFGKAGCSSITVEPFTPICSFEAPAGTTPLTFDVPAVSVAMPVPPAECQCFDFEGTTTTGVVTAACGEGGSSFSTTIEPVGDCCSGKYQVKTTGSVTVPCMPFTVAKPEVAVTNADGSSDNVDGSASMTLEAGTGVDCCTLKSGLHIELPKCRKEYDKSATPLNQITFCNKGVEKGHQFITMVQDEANCSLYPRVHPLEIPCCTLADTSGYSAFNVNGRPYTFGWTRKDCEYTFTMPDITIDIPIPSTQCQPEFDVSTKKKIGYKYYNEDGEEDVVESADDASDADATVWMGRVDNAVAGGCPKYVLHVGTLDLTDLPSVAFGDEGHVYAVSKEDAEKKTKKNNLYIDGSASGEPWFAGGIGNREPDAPKDIMGLGSNRGASYPDGWGSPDSNGDYVPYAENHKAHTIANASNNTAWYWRSRRVADDNDPENAPDGATGPLVVPTPTGFEWHTRGVAMRLGEFVFNEAGVLSDYGEYWCSLGRDGKPNCDSHSCYDVIVAPGLATAEYSGKTYNAGGLVVHPKKQNSATFDSENAASGVSGLTSGLAVNPGKGLRIHGVTGMKPDKTKHGHTDSTGNDAPTTGDIGKLEILKRDDDLAFTSDGHLGFNDAVPIGNKSGVTGYDGEEHISGITTTGYVGTEPKLTLRFYRGSGYDYTIPLVVIAPPNLALDCNADYFKSKPTTSGHPGGCGSTGGGEFIRFKEGADFESVAGMLGIMYLHVSASGVILGIDYTSDCSACCRRTK